MSELKAGDKVVYGTFVGTVRQLIKDTHCVIALRAPMSDGAVSVVAPVEECEVVTEFQPEPAPVVESEIPAEPVEETPSEEPAAPEEPQEAPAAEEPPAKPTTEGEVTEPVT